MTMRRNLHHISLCRAILVGMAIVGLAACSRVSVPDSFSQSSERPRIYPDYIDVTIPVNISPLSFQMDDDAQEMVARYSFGQHDIVCGGEKAQPPVEEWKQLTAEAQGKDIQVEVFARYDGGWKRFQPFHITVSPDSIDPYVSYRVISPSYVTYEELSINQHSLENYDESIIYSNMLCSTEESGQCINCHNYQQFRPERMQFHARQNHGGTIIAYDGDVRKINMKNDSILSAGVYPAWHPWLKLIVYSTNHTNQVFHTRDLNKIEVFDSGSDIIAYDIDRNEVTNVQNDPDEFEVFPFWAPDGKTLYYCSAHFEFKDTTSHEVEVIRRAKEVRYNLYRMSFDPDTWQFGPRELVFRADSLDKSATLPRISPDGRFLMFTLGSYGCFHIWHRDADLWMIDLKSGVVRAMDEINSTNTESYHSWSSNGRWVIFSSRRDDGGYTRPFIAHIDKDGKGSKPFEMPEEDPARHREYLKCYNIPEFMAGPVTISPQTFADVLKSDGEAPVKYVHRLRNQ